MNLDELKERLAAQDARLDQLVRLNAAAVRELQVSKAKTSLRWLVPGIVVELVLTALAIVWLGDFIYEHLRQLRFVVPAVLLDLSLFGLLASCLLQLVAIASLDYSLPVVAVQKELGKLRILRIRTTKWALILSFALWFPASVVLVEGFLGVDLWTILGAVAQRDGNFLTWLVLNVLLGVGFALLLIWAWTRYAGRKRRSPVIERLMDDLAGRSLTKARAAVDAIVRFESEL